VKVLFLIDAQGGGAMTHVLNLAEGLHKENIFPEILFFTEGPSIEEAKKRNISTYLILKKGVGLVFFYRLYRFLKKNRYDILHTHTINANFFGRIAGKISGIKVLLTTVHSHVIDELKGLKKPSIFDHVRYRIDIFLSRWNRFLVVVSEAIREQLINQDIPASKIRVIENGVDINKFKPNFQIGLDVRKELGIPEEAKVVGIIGRIVPLKNHDLFLRSAEKISKNRKDVYFLIVGDGPLLSSIRNYAKSLGLSNRVIFTGWYTDIERIIPALDMLVLCSQVEGHNIVVLEAMACGKPVIGTDVRGIHTMVKHGENGMLVPVDNSTALAKAILYLIENPQVAERMGNTARNYVAEKYDADYMISAYLKLYQETEFL
jgi:glycosyltransferase involved in cell wall biosynthesis